MAGEVVVTRRFLLLGSAALLLAPKVALPDLVLAEPAVPRIKMIVDLKARSIFDFGVDSLSNVPSRCAVWRGSTSIIDFTVAPMGSYRWVAPEDGEIAVRDESIVIDASADAAVHAAWFDERRRAYAQSWRVVNGVMSIDTRPTPITFEDVSVGGEPNESDDGE